MVEVDPRWRRYGLSVEAITLRSGEYREIVVMCHTFVCDYLDGHPHERDGFFYLDVLRKAVGDEAYEWIVNIAAREMSS